MNGLTNGMLDAARDMANTTGEPQIIRRSSDGEHHVEQRKPGPVPTDTIMVVYPVRT